MFRYLIYYPYGDTQVVQSNPEEDRDMFIVRVFRQLVAGAFPGATEWQLIRVPPTIPA